MSTGVGEVLQGSSERLIEAGVPLARSHISFRTLHPLFALVSDTWVRGTGLASYSHEHDNLGRVGWL
jgi:adenylate cyclase